MAQSKNTGKKNTGGKSGSAKSKSASGQLNSVRGGSQRQGSRAQDAARKAAGRSEAKPQEKKAPAAQTAPKPAEKPASAPKQSGAQKKKKLEPWQKMLIVAAVVLIGVIGALNAVSCSGSRSDTRQVVMVTLSDSIETTGVAIRNERVVTSERQGVIVSAIDNGGKVSKGETVANIFRSTDEARAYERMAEIEEALAQFESMATAGEESASEVSALEKAIREELLDLSELIFDGDASGAAEVSEELLYMLNKTQVATRVVDDFSEKVKELENELADLKARYPEQPGQLNSPLSGYYISQADGYESLLNTEICATLTPEKLDEIMSVRSEPSDTSIVGKIADDYIWYMACEVSAEEADRLAKNSDGSFKQNYYKLYLTYSELDSIDAKLVRVNTGADASRKILIFECSYMVSELSTVRIQPITIELSSYSGLEIGEGSIVTREVTVSSSDIEDYDSEGREALAKAMYPQLFEEKPEASDSDAAAEAAESPYATAARRLINEPSTAINKIVDGLKLPDEVTFTQKGVYIMWGNEIKFRRISVVYQTGSKVLCEYNVDDGYLKMYDNVIINPGRVYDGQIINPGR